MASANHMIRASEAVDQAARHHHDLGRRAMDRGDQRRAAECHAALGRCLRSAQSAFQAMADQAVLDDIAANQQTQNSGGVGPGISASYSPPLSRLQRLADVARLGGPVIGAVAAREREVVIEMARLEECAAAGCFSRPRIITAEQRRADLQRLQRSP